VEFDSAAAVAAIDAIEAVPELATWLGGAIDPVWGAEAAAGTGGTVQVGTITLPQPQLEETYEAYAQRLRSAGWLGTLVVTEDAAPSAYFGPLEVTAMSYAPATGSPVLLDMLDPWPLNPPPLASQEGQIELFYAPASTPERTAEEEADVGTEIPGLIQGGTSGGLAGCSGCPDLNLGPLTGLDWSENFPFGVFVWLGSTWEDMTGSPATCLRGSFGKSEAIGGGTLVVGLCSSAWVDTYRDPFFLLVEFIFTVALILGLARRFLNIGGLVDEA